MQTAPHPWAFFGTLYATCKRGLGFRSKYGARKTVNSRFWPWFSGKKPQQSSKLFPFQSEIFKVVPSSAGIMYNTFKTGLGFRAASKPRGNNLEYFKNFTYLKTRAKIWPVVQSYPCHVGSTVATQQAPVLLEMGPSEQFRRKLRIFSPVITPG